MRLILDDPNVKAILVNIFGGITRGDEVARGLIEARAQQEREVPMVVRIVGTNAAEAAELLEAASFVTAAEPRRGGRAKAVAAAKGARHEHPDRPRHAPRRPGHHRAARASSTAGRCSSTAPRSSPAMTPGKGGQTALDGARARCSTRSSEAVRETGANTSCIFVPAAGAPDAVLESVAAGITTIFCITEGIPALDMIPVVEEVRLAGATLIGPNCPGATSPGQGQGRDHPGLDPPRGRVGVVSRSGTLTYEAVQAMTDAGIGQSTCVGHRRRPGHRDAVPRHPQAVRRRPRDRGARADRRDRRRGRGGGGGLGRRAPARTCPRSAFIAGRTAPEGKRMGHAGAIVSGGRGTAASKVDGARGRRASASPAPPPSCPALLREAGYRG